MRTVALFCGVLLFVWSCGRAQGTTEEITFRSGPFRVVGDLKLPQGSGPHPVVVFVHGDGPNNRTSGVTYPPIMRRMLRAGYATFAWDKPGTGESTGEIDRSRLTEQRSQIVLDAVEVLKQRADIDPQHIGLWGISQAGYVMPRVLQKSRDIAFMIAISCAGGPGVEQGIYLLASQMVCAGYPKEDAKQLEQDIRAFTMARTYEEYVRYKTPLVDLPAFRAMARFGQRVEIGSEDDWHPADPRREYYGFDPMEVIERTTIPVLAFFGERDTQVDPIQGAQAYREALARAGNPHSRVELIPGVDHNILISETGCIEERNRRSAAGWRNYPAEYLDIIEQWLREVRRP
ncbi:MAG: alpha/beta fold hydrolase [Gemmatimonadales bacterium]|nr:alpha/beta fold hydrolase [Gemmatimonadales bacterium]NIR01222.1 alpha/beta fold hydrolase [Gemmatimonadales bacterium]NIS65245.1 alpha/beta fold hydrolase [Gemmatimonadales bacterium]